MSQLNSSAQHNDSNIEDNILLQRNIICTSAGINKNEVCCVPGCWSGKRKNTRSPSGVSFHIFPTSDQPQRRQKWLQLLGINSLETKGALVCSRHFDNSDFFLINSVQKGQTYRVLRKTALPSRALPSQIRPHGEVQRPKLGPSRCSGKKEYITGRYLKINEVKTFCRCCLKLDSKSRNMKDTRMILDGSTINLFDAFFDCTSFKALEVDDQAQICGDCVIDLERTIVFLSTCQASDALINKLFGTNNATAEDTNTTDTENEDGGDLLVPMRSDEPVVLTKQEPKSLPSKPVIKTEVIDVDYEDVITTAQIRPTKKGYAVKRTAPSTASKPKSRQEASSDEDIGESVDREDTEWTDKSIKHATKPKVVLNPTLRKRGRPRKTSQPDSLRECIKGQTSSDKQTDKRSLEKLTDSETDTAESGVVTNAEPLKRKRGRPSKGVASRAAPKRKYTKWVYLSPTAPLDVSEMMPLAGARATATTALTTAKPASTTSSQGDAVKKRWPYACNECGETFKLQVYLRYHQKSIHPKSVAAEQFKKLETSDTNKDKKLKWGCKRCIQTFDSLAGYQQHMHEHNSANLRNPRFECSMCNTGFFRLERFSGHIEKAHSITMDKYTPKYHCNRCRMNFHVADDFYNHPKYCMGLRKTDPMTKDKPSKIGTKERASKSFIEIPPSFFFCYNCTTGYLEKKYFDQHLDDCYTSTELFFKCCICDVDVHLIDCNFKWSDRVNYKLHMMSDHQIKYNPKIHGPQPNNVRLSVEKDDEFFGF